jgi:tetratricopeptide (TPR) repeat protein
LSWNYLGVIHDDARRNVEAIACFERAIKEQEIAIDKTRDADLYKGFLCYHLDNLGEQFIDLGRLSDGMPHYERALRISRELSAADPKNRFHALELVKRLVALGNIRRHEGVPLGARQLFAEATSIVERLLGPTPGEPTLKTWLAVVLDSEANTMMDQEQPEKARSLLERAAALFHQELDRPTPASAIGPEREARSEALWDLARVLRALKLPTEASRADAERINVCNACPPDELVTLALKETSRAVLIGFGRTDVSEQAKAVRKLDLDQAAGHLQLGIARGFKDLSRLKADPDAQFLLSRDDLKSAIEGLESPK